MNPIRPLGRVGAVMLLAFIVPVAAATAHEPLPDGVPSFNESAGCDALSGIRGPLADAPGLLELHEPIYGPWADFYGRTVGQAWAQRVAFTFPTTSGPTKTFWVHERVMPALQPVLDDLAAAGTTYTVRTGETFSWARFTIPPTRAFSFHAVGAAIDINSLTNPYRADNVLITDMPTWFVDIWRNNGWCWGGDWGSIKDTMHFSWRGPLHTPGYVMPPPQPPLVAAAGFTATVPLDVRLGPADPGRRLFVIDIDRDGAPDVVAVSPAAAGKVALTAAPARNDFHWDEGWGTTSSAPIDPGAPAIMGDVTGDGRPDLVYLLAGPLDMIDLEIHAHTGGSNLTASNILTAVPHQADAWYALDDYDRDGITDLFVVRPGDPTTLEVWDGDGFTTTLINVEIDLDGTEHLVLGDRFLGALDGVPDLYALGGDGTLRIWDGAGGYGSSTTVATGIDPTGRQVASGDLDGDGHTDLFLVAADGSTEMRRGGASTHHPGVWYRIRTHQVNRIAGFTRYDTAAAVSAAMHPDPVDTVFVAVGHDFPDALTGSAVAGRLGAPLLLVTRDSLPDATAAELARLEPETIVILGGTAVVSAAVESQLGGYAGEVLRVAGANRYQTAVEISRFGFPTDGSADTVVIATGLGYADALTGGPAAAALNGPLLLTETGHLPATVRAEIERLDPERILVLGGSTVISNAVFAELQGLAPTQRIAGSDRYQTAAMLSAAVFPEGAEAIFIVTGSGYPDGLAGGAAAATRGIPLLLVSQSSLPGTVRAEILRLGTYQVTLVGGEAVISPTVAGAVETAGM